MTPLNHAKVALACHDAKGAIGKLDSPSFEDAALAAMRAARGNFMAPTEDEAFVGALGALAETFPDQPILAEVEALADRAKVLEAIANGVPVDMDAALSGFASFADPPLDLVGLWDRALEGGP